MYTVLHDWVHHSWNYSQRFWAKTHNSPGFPAGFAAALAACSKQCERDDSQASSWPLMLTSSLLFSGWNLIVDDSACEEAADSHARCVEPHHWKTRSSSSAMFHGAGGPVDVLMNFPGSSNLKESLLLHFSFLKCLVFLFNLQILKKC